VILRKYAKKGNEIGIFRGKRAKYNLAILETLLEHPCTSWQIAKAITKRQHSSKSKEFIHYRSQEIYSVIQRKKGRLEELFNKGYIERDGKVWSLTPKGFVALMLANPDLIAQRTQSLKSRVLEKILSIPIKLPFGIQIDKKSTREGLKKAASLLEDPAFVKIFAEEARTLVQEGIDLDRIDFQVFMSLILQSERMKKILNGKYGEKNG